jgi:hypothetical protein
MKIIVLTVSRHFPKVHPEAGNETNFVESILNRTKETTIRKNYARWRTIKGKVNAGTHLISLRYWTDKPYRSKQVEFAICTKISIDRVFITNDHNGLEMSVNGNYQDDSKIFELVKKEGFSNYNNFADWFKTEEFSGVMIGFLELEKQQLSLIKAAKSFR